MAKINSDTHGLYFSYNGLIWRPLIPKKEKSIAASRNMLPLNESSFVGNIAKPKYFEEFFICVEINKIDYLWYNHGKKKKGLKSDLIYRNFEQEELKIKELIASGLSPKEAYLELWKSLT
jgi:hypothetical protein